MPGVQLEGFAKTYNQYLPCPFCQGGMAKEQLMLFLTDAWAAGNVDSSRNPVATFARKVPVPLCTIKSILLVLFG